MKLRKVISYRSEFFQTVKEEKELYTISESDIWCVNFVFYSSTEFPHNNIVLDDNEIRNLTVKKQGKRWGINFTRSLAPISYYLFTRQKLMPIRFYPEKKQW